MDFVTGSILLSISGFVFSLLHYSFFFFGSVRQIKLAIPISFRAHENIHRESKKGATLTMAITLSILGGFAKFFHCYKEQ